MKSPQYNNSVFNPPGQYEQRIAYLENQVRTLNETLKKFFVQGRLRTDRTAPANSADVQSPDQLYDRVLLNNFEYVLINNAGTLAWRRITLAAF